LRSLALPLFLETLRSGHASSDPAQRAAKLDPLLHLWRTLWRALARSRFFVRLSLRHSSVQASKRCADLAGNATLDRA
jgi:hypothetical protein